MGLLKIAEEARRRGVAKVECTAKDVTALFSSPGPGIIRKVVSGGGRVSCVAAKGMAGLLGFEPFPGIRLGRELAEIARSNSLGGVVHSDELRKQKVTEAEEEELRRMLAVDGAAALVLVAGPPERVATVVSLVTERLKVSLDGVPRETRAATDLGETAYMRPRPGAARMYPETDIPDMVVTDEALRAAESKLPFPWEQKVKTLETEYSLSRDLALQLYDSGQTALYESLARRLRLDGTVLASLLVEVPSRLANEGVPEDRVTPQLLEAVGLALGSGLFAKEAVYDVLKSVASGEAGTVDEAVARLGLKTMSDEELERLVREVLERNDKLIAERGERAFSPVMGEVMKVARGKVDGAKVSATIKRLMNGAGPARASDAEE
jgi:glutamyl-tRNA(Gln) amidotransferase subunit E